MMGAVAGLGLIVVIVAMGFLASAPKPSKAPPRRSRPRLIAVNGRRTGD